MGRGDIKSRVTLKDKKGKVGSYPSNGQQISGV